MSQSIACLFYLATDNQWYLNLGNFEYVYDDIDCTTYGPFKTMESAQKHLKHFPSTSSEEIDDSCSVSPPENYVTIKN